MTKHGLSKTQFNSIWYGIRQRCNNPNSASYKSYGSRGIKCKWGSFDLFINDMYQSYIEHVDKFGENNTTIDRIDNNGHYSAENCRWATYSEQNKNKSNARLIEFNHKKTNLTDVAKSIGIKPTILFNRIHRGWTTEKAISVPNTYGKHLRFK